MPNIYAAGQRLKSGVVPDAKSQAGRILPQGQAAYADETMACSPDSQYC